MDNDGVIQLRIVPNVGAERFAEFLFNKLNPWVLEDTDGRVCISEIEFSENPNNSGIYKE